MSDGSAIEWTDDSWNPIRARNLATGKVGWHCIHASEGCRFCYAETFNRRLGTGLDYKPQAVGAIEVFLDPKVLAQPLSKRAARKIFPCSMTDLFADFVTDEMLDQIFAVMALTPHLTYQVVTKRPDRARAYFAGIPELPNEPGARDAMLEGAAQALYHQRTGEDPSMWLAVHAPLPNVWIGTSVEDQKNADIRRPHLAALAEAGWTTWVSYEPTLGPVDWTGWEFIRWLVCGGESGPKARPMHPDWARAARDFCAAHLIAFFFKQWGNWEIASHANGRRNGYDGHMMPETGERFTWLGRDGTRANPSAAGLDDAYAMARVGKIKAGRLLDDVEHSAFPATVTMEKAA